MPMQGRYRLSPFCVFNVEPGNHEATLRHARYGSRFTLDTALLIPLAQLANGVAAESVAAPLGDEAQKALQMLVDERVILASDDPEDAERTLLRNRLDPVELALHRGINEGGYFPDEVDPRDAPPGVKEVTGEQVIELAFHSAAALPTSLADCLTARRSVRAYSGTPLARRDLELFLQFAAGARGLIDTVATGQVSYRNYPGGGGLHPLEIYPVVYNVESIEPGIYHYHPFRHHLTRLPSQTEHRDALADMAAHRMGSSDPVRPSVLFLVTAVFARMCWKYRGMRYQAILLETGALYQTMYLVATQLNLACCAIGAFPELATAQLLGVDSLDEAQVGMLALGIPAGTTAPGWRVTRVRLLSNSPFSRSDRPWAVELTYADSSRETVPLDRLKLIQLAGGALGCLARGGRAEVTFDESAGRELLGLIERAKR